MSDATGRDDNTGLFASANAGRAYLAGASDWKSKLAPTISGANVAEDKIGTVLRYVGADDSFSEGYRGGLTFSSGVTTEGTKVQEAIPNMAANTVSAVKSIVSSINGGSSYAIPLTGDDRLDTVINKFNKVSEIALFIPTPMAAGLKVESWMSLS